MGTFYYLSTQVLTIETNFLPIGGFLINGSIFFVNKGSGMKNSIYYCHAFRNPTLNIFMTVFLTPVNNKKVNSISIINDLSRYIKLHSYFIIV